MTSTLSHDGSAVALEYLQHVESMRQQLLTATDAIARNSLTDFEQSLWQQEMIATCMRRNLLTLRGLDLHPSLLGELRSANTVLQRESAAYQGLIGQCSQTASLLRGLCSLHGQSPSAGTSRSRTLYCEA